MEEGKEKTNAYTDLEYEILNEWRGVVNEVVILPVIIGALGFVTENSRRKWKCLIAEMDLKSFRKHVYWDLQEESGKCWAL